MRSFEGGIRGIFMEHVFNSLKQKVVNLIKQNIGREITHNSEVKKNGIYLIYVDDFSDDKVIPFYIGQTVNIQERYKQHYMELLALNRFCYEVYESNLFRESFHSGIASYYEGHFKMCKIFKYMVDHECTLGDFHMIILEEDVDELEELEQHYFEEYLPAFFGFNQMNTSSESRKGISDEEGYAYMLSDGEKLKKYIDYGYSLFNYLHTYPKKKNENYPHELNSVIEELWVYYDRKEAEVIQEEYNDTVLKYNERLERKREVEKKIKNLISNDLDGYFLSNSLKSKEKYKKILDELCEEIPDLKEIENYVKRYSKDEGKGLYDILEKNAEQLALYRSELKETADIHEESAQKYFLHRYSVQRRKFEMIFPNKKYTDYPLKSNYVPFEFPDAKGQNICQVYIEYTSERFNLEWDIYPEIMCIMIRYIDAQEKVVEKHYWVQNGLENVVANENIYYIENRNRMSFYNKPFNPILINHDCMISLNMEYKTGINEYVLSQVATTPLLEIFSSIEEFIDEDTRIFLYSNTQGVKRKLDELRYRDDFKHNLFIKKLLRIVKKK